MNQTLAHVILIKGPDARDFIQRLSTNDVTSLSQGDSCLNGFLTQKGRFVSLVHMLCVEKDSYLLVPSPGSHRRLIEFLESYHFVEDIELLDVSDRYYPYFADAPREKLCMPSFCGVFLNVSNSPQNQEQDTFYDRFMWAGIPFSEEAIGEACNPLELGFEKIISWTKGCYIGQEVISRLKTYQQQSRQLVFVQDVEAALRLAAGKLTILARAGTKDPHKVAALALLKGDLEAIQGLCRPVG